MQYIQNKRRKSESVVEKNKMPTNKVRFRESEKSKRVLDVIAGIVSEYHMFEPFEYGHTMNDPVAGGKTVKYFIKTGTETIYALSFYADSPTAIFALDAYSDDLQVHEDRWVFSEDAEPADVAYKIIDILTGSEMVQEAKRKTHKFRRELNESKKILQERRDLMPYFEEWFEQTEGRMDLLRYGTFDEIKRELSASWYEHLRLPHEQTIKNKVRKILSNYGYENSNLEKRKYTKKAKANADFEDTENDSMSSEEEQGLNNFVEEDTEEDDLYEKETPNSGGALEHIDEEEIEGFGEAFMQMDHWSERWGDYVDNWELFLGNDWRKIRDTANFRGMITYGQGGSGKSFYAKQMLDQYPNRIGYVQGKDLKASAADVFQVIFENRDKDIIVFDDADIIVSKSAVTKYKTLFEPPAEGGANVTPQTNRQQKVFEDAGVPDGFVWRGANIIITNRSLNSIGDGAFRDRFLKVGLNFSAKETIAKIAEEYDAPGVSDEEKYAAAKFLLRLLATHGVKPGSLKASFRMFGTIIHQRQFFPNKWQKKAKRNILSDKDLVKASKAEFKDR